MAKKLNKKQIRAQLHREWRKQYDDFEIIQNTNGNCAICGRPPKEGGRRLHVDSDHRTNTPRGLLCGQCNRKLRYYLTADWLRKAADYLDDPPFHNVSDEEI